MDRREELPARVGGYDVVLRLAAGGMATTYLARRAGAAGVERLVVLKRVHGHLLERPEALGMLQDEARIAALVRHPHVVSVEDVIELGGELVLVMPYVEAAPLAALIKGAAAAGERLPPAVASRVIVDVLSGLHAAHEARDLEGRPLEVVHRDVSPRNVLVGADGKSVIIDFGIAKAARRSTSTQSGELKGTFSYMAPEQLRGRRDIDRRADLFAAGALLHEALTGAPLFGGEDQASVLIGILADEIPAPSERAPGVPPEVDRIVLRALARDREERFPTAADFLEALERALPPAPAREVAALVERHAGAILAGRREAVRAWLAQAPAVGAEAAPEVGAASVSAPAPAAALAPTTDTAPAPRAPRRRAALVVMGVLAPAAVALALLGRSAVQPSAERASELPATAAPPPLAPASAPSATPASPAIMELRIEAAAPIEAVRAPGLVRVDRQGSGARIEVAAWSGTLVVEVTLEGGSLAIARFEQDGPRAARVAAAQPASPTARPRPRRPELQANPY